MLYRHVAYTPYPVAERTEEREIQREGVLFAILSLTSPHDIT